MSLKVWLPLDGDLHNQGISAYQVAEVGTTIDNSGKIGQCYSFNGTSSRITISNFSIGNIWSYGAWIYAPTSSRSWEGAIILNTNGGDTDMQLGFYTYPAGNKIQSTANGQYNSSISMTYGQWNHLFATFDGSNLKTYINGILVNTKTITNTQLTRTNLTIGARCRGSSYDCFFSGKINDVRIYDHCLSAAEVKEIAQGLILHYKLNDQYIESTTNLSNPNSMGGWNNSGTCVRNQNDTTLPKSPSGSRIYSVTSTSAGSMAATMGTTIFNVPSKTLTCSIYCYLSGTQDSSTVYIRSTKTDGSIGSLEYNGSSNPTTWPKNQWIRLTKTLTTNNEATTIYFCTYINPTDCTRAFSGWQIEARNYTTPYTNSEYLSNNLNISTNNLITGLVAGGRTTISGSTVTTTGTDADTYFYLKLSTPMIKNHLYKLSCNVSGLANDGYWSFPIAGQSNTTIPAFVLKNGYNELIFRANDNCVSAGNSVIMDDNGATSRTVVMTVNNFKLVDVTPIIYDSSGFNNNGTIVGEFNMNITSPRYDKSLYLHSIDPTTNSEKGISYIQTPLSLTTPLQLSFVWWAKPESGYGGSSNHAAFCTSNQTISPTDYNTTAFHHRDAGFDIYPSDGSGVKRLSFTYILNQWHHYAVTYDGTTARAYQDGELKSSIEVGANKTLASFFQLYIGFSKAGGVWRKTLGSYSDFRVYVTQLLDTDIKQLYNVSMKIDNQYNIHAFEMIEHNVNKINKYGQVQFSTIYENGLMEKLHYDKTIYTEPDSSTWVRIFHHNDPTTSGLFVKTSDWEHGVYESANKWYDIEQIIPLLIKYEFMVKQKTTSSANETKYRWIQTANPLTCAYSDVSPGHVTINTSTGYTNSSYGGLWKMNSSARMCIANSSSGNWYGAMGSWTVYNTNNVPGYPNSNISTGYLDFYVRVYPNVKDIKNYGLTANEFIER